MFLGFALSSSSRNSFWSQFSFALNFYTFSFFWSFCFYLFSRNRRNGVIISLLLIVLVVVFFVLWTTLNHLRRWSESNCRNANFWARLWCFFFFILAVVVVVVAAAGGRTRIVFGELQGKSRRNGCGILCGCGELGYRNRHRNSGVFPITINCYFVVAPWTLGTQLM